ncbi:MAG TPA: RICIN domain-containing protein [Actinocrinis sp.]|nr:RICIN domain-containing protein [Actinocrinis sp.]
MRCDTRAGPRAPCLPIVNRGSGTALAGAGATTAGSTAELWAPNSSANNEWTITAV